MASPFTVADWSARFLSGRLVSTFENWDDLLEHTQTICTDIKSYEETKPESEFDLLPVLIYAVTRDAGLSSQIPYNIRLSNSETGFYGEPVLGPAVVPLSKVIRGVVAATGVLLEDTKDDITGKIETVSDVIEKIARDYCTRNGHYDEKAEIEHNYADKPAQIGMDVVTEEGENKIKYYAKQDMLEGIMKSARNHNLYKKGGINITLNQTFEVGNTYQFPTLTSDRLMTKTKLKNILTYAFQNISKYGDGVRSLKIPNIDYMVNQLWKNDMGNAGVDCCIDIRCDNEGYFQEPAYALDTEITLTVFYTYVARPSNKTISSNSKSQNLLGTDFFIYSTMENNPMYSSKIFRHNKNTEEWTVANNTTSGDFRYLGTFLNYSDNDQPYFRRINFKTGLCSFLDAEEQQGKYKYYVGSTQPSNDNISSDYPNWYNNKIDTSSIATREGQQVITTIPYIPLGINNVDDGYPVTQNPADTQSGFPAKTEKLDDITYPPIDIPQNPSIDIPAVDSNMDIANDIAGMENPAISISPSADVPLEQLPTPSLPPLPSLGGAGLGTVFRPSSSEMSEIKSKLWNEDVLTFIRNIFSNNPTDAIISCSICFANPTLAGTRRVKFGYYDTQIDCHYVENPYVTINCGTVKVDELYSNYMDYEPYTSVAVFLPFIGIRELQANDIIGKTVKIVYRCDVVTGSCIALISVINNENVEQLIYNFEGNCSISIPITSSQYNLMNIFSGIVHGGSVGASLGGSWGGIAGMAVGGLTGAIPSVIKEGGISGNVGALANKKPYLIIKRLKPCNAYNFNSIIGFGANKTVKLSECSGYTRVRDCHVDGIRCTDTEKEMIYNLLKEGIIL